MAHLGNTQLIYVISCPPEHVAEGDRIFDSHAVWMEATHHRDGDKALLTYNVSKAPELANPFDPESEPTGNTVFVLHEIYQSDAGVGDHFAQAMDGWDDFPALLAWLEKCTVTGTPMSSVNHSLW